MSLTEGETNRKKILNSLFAGDVISESELNKVCFYWSEDFLDLGFSPVYSKQGEEFLQVSIAKEWLNGVNNLKILSTVPQYDALMFHSFCNGTINACACTIGFYKNRLTPQQAGKLRAIDLNALYVLQEIAGEEVSKDFYSNLNGGWCSTCCNELEIDLRVLVAAIPEKNLVQAAKTGERAFLPVIFEDPRSSDAVKWECIKRLSQEVLPYTLLEGEFTVPAKITALQLQKTLIYLYKCLYVKTHNLPTKEGLAGLLLPLSLKGNTADVALAQTARNHLEARSVSGLTSIEKLEGLDQRLSQDPIGFLKEIAMLPESLIRKMFTVKIKINILYSSEEADEFSKELGGLL